MPIGGAFADGHCWVTITRQTQLFKCTVHSVVVIIITSSSTCQ